jgi:hypothetical protein
MGFVLLWGWRSDFVTRIASSFVEMCLKPASPPERVSSFRSLGDRARLDLPRAMLGAAGAETFIVRAGMRGGARFPFALPVRMERAASQPGSWFLGISLAARLAV